VFSQRDFQLNLLCLIFSGSLLQAHVPRQQLIQRFIVSGIQVRQLFKQMREVCVGIQPIFLSCLHHAINDGAGAGSLWSITKEPIFSANYKRLDGAFRPRMPTSGLCRYGEPGSRSSDFRARDSRHNQRPSRKASKRSGGRYRSGTRPDGLACASACSFSCISACK
jgi:hypothetical protein